MEQVRLLLAVVLSFLVFVVWQWLFVEPDLAKQAQEQAKLAEGTTENSQVKEQEETPAAASDKSSEIPPSVIPMPTSDGREARTITIETPLFTVTLSEQGAALESLTLKNYRETANGQGALKEMIHERARLLNLRFGWDGNSVRGMEDAVFELDRKEDVIVVEDAKQALAFEWVNQDGISVEKEFVFLPDSYLIEMNVQVSNHSAAAIVDKPVVKVAQVIDDPSSRLTFEGPMALIDNHLEEITFDDVADKPDWDGTFRWVGMTDRYFMTVLIPETAAAGRMKLETVGEDLVISRLVLEETTVAPGKAQVLNYKAFIGPKDTETLKRANYELPLAINFGWFDFLAKPFLWIMNQIYKVIPNYGIAIIILTLITKVILWPLGNKSYKSMNDMKRMQPLMAEIREKYKDDKKKINEETMALYRTYKINPMGGCLPMIVQLPVFFALYRMLYQAIELRHAPFFGWIDDLSAPDRLFEFGFSIPFMEPPYGIPVLTIVMGATMFLQQKMSPPPGDPTQAKLMMFMPLIFTFIFINFSSGLVLYWLINNVFSIGQQYYIQKKYA